MHVVYLMKSIIPETLLGAYIQFFLKLEVCSIGRQCLIRLVILSFPKFPNALNNSIGILYLIQRIVRVRFCRIFTPCGGTLIRSRLLTLGVDVKTWKCCINTLSISIMP